MGSNRKGVKQCFTPFLYDLVHQINESLNLGQYSVKAEIPAGTNAEFAFDINQHRRHSEDGGTGGLFRVIFDGHITVAHRGITDGSALNFFANCAAGQAGFGAKLNDFNAHRFSLQQQTDHRNGQHTQKCRISDGARSKRHVAAIKLGLNGDC